MVQMFVSSPKFYVKILVLRVMVLGAGAFARYLGQEPSWMGLVPL